MVITGNMFSEMQLLAEGATILSRQLQSSLLHISLPMTIKCYNQFTRD